MPYLPEQVAQLFTSIEKAHSRKRRHDLAALLVMCLATGASGQEAALVRGDDVHETGDGVVVTLRRRRDDGGTRERQVTVLESWQSRLLELRVPANEYLIGGGTTRHSRVYDLCLCSKDGNWPVELDPGRARSTYLVEVALSCNTVPALLERAGVITLEVYDDLLKYIRAVRPMDDKAT